MIELNTKQYIESLRQTPAFGDSIEYEKDTYEHRALSLVEIYNNKNITAYVKNVFRVIKDGTQKGRITITKDTKFSLDSYIIYLNVLSKLLRDTDKYELVICTTTHIRANNYGVKYFLSHNIIDMQKGIKLGANYNNVRLKRQRGTNTDFVYYKYNDEKIILADNIREYTKYEQIQKFNESKDKIKFEEYNLPDAYLIGNDIMIPLIGIKCIKD